MLLEAHARGVPAVTTAAGGAAEIVADGETGFVLPVGDLEGLSGGLLQLCPPERRERAGRAARQRVCELFSLEVMLKAYRELYEEDFAKD